MIADGLLLIALGFALAGLRLADALNRRWSARDRRPIDFAPLMIAVAAALAAVIVEMATAG